MEMKGKAIEKFNIREKEPRSKIDMELRRVWDKQVILEDHWVDMEISLRWVRVNMIILSFKMLKKNHLAGKLVSNRFIQSFKKNKTN